MSEQEKHIRYEQEKRRLQALGLSHEEYEKHIKILAEKLGL